VLEGIGLKTEAYDAAGLESAVSSLVGGGRPMSALISALFFEAGAKGLEIKSVYLQLIKGVLTFEGTAHKLEPDYSLEGRLQALVPKDIPAAP
jgi:hypothetical protein